MNRKCTVTITVVLASVLLSLTAPSVLWGQTAETETLPRDFSGIALGMGLQEVKDLLLIDTNFDFRGDPDVSLLARPNETLIECTGFTYIDRAFFQFYEGSLYTIIIMLDTSELDHYTMYSHLSGKYGDPSALDPSRSMWESEEVVLSLERPLTVKYVDRQVFESIRRAGEAEETMRALSRDDFVGQF